MYLQTVTTVGTAMLNVSLPLAVAMVSVLISHMMPKTVGHAATNASKEFAVFMECEIMLRVSKSNQFNKKEQSQSACLV